MSGMGEVTGVSLTRRATHTGGTSHESLIDQTDQVDRPVRAQSSDSVISLPQAYIEKLHYAIYSVDLPLGTAIGISSIDATIDSIVRKKVSPSFMGPVLGLAFLFGYGYFLRDKRVNVFTQRGRKFHANAVRFLCIVLFVCTIALLSLESPPSFNAVAAVTRLMPPWFGGIVARTWRQAVVLLSVHFVLVLLFGTGMPDYWNNLFFLLLLDMAIIVIAWSKQQLIWIVDQLMSTQDNLAQTFQQSTQALASQLDEAQSSLHQSVTREVLVSHELQKTRGLASQLERSWSKTKAQLGLAKKQYSDMSKVAEAAVQLAQKTNVPGSSSPSVSRNPSHED